MPEDFTLAHGALHVRQTYDRPQDRALAAARLSCEDEDPAAPQAETHAVHGRPLTVGDHEIAHGEQRFIAHDFFSKSALIS